eukprot:18536-Heterococcus_DN1.PRE.3
MLAVYQCSACGIAAWCSCSQHLLLVIAQYVHSRACSAAYDPATYSTAHACCSYSKTLSAYSGKGAGA